MEHLTVMPFFDFYAIYQGIRNSKPTAGRSEAIEDLHRTNSKGQVIYSSGDVVIYRDLTLNWIATAAGVDASDSVVGVFFDGHLTIKGNLLTHEKGGFFYFAGDLTVENVVQIQAEINCPAHIQVNKTCLCAYPEGYVEGATIAAKNLIVTDHHFSFSKVACDFAIGLGQGWFYGFPNDIVENARSKAREIAKQRPDIDAEILAGKAVSQTLTKVLGPDACYECEINIEAILERIRLRQPLFLQPPLDG